VRNSATMGTNGNKPMIDTVLNLLFNSPARQAIVNDDLAVRCKVTNGRHLPSEAPTEAPAALPNVPARA